MITNLKDFKNRGVLEFEDIIVTTLLNSVLFFYLFFSYRKLNRTIEKKSLSEKTTSKLKLNTTKKIILALLIIIVVEAFLDILLQNDLVSPILITFFFYGVIYLSLVQSDLSKSLPIKKYKFSKLDELKSEEINTSLRVLMEKEKVFLNNSLSLSHLAEKLNISPHILSQFINERFNQNFFHFVNKYRIEEAKILLIDNRKNISEIAFQVGFNSLSAFNSAFKKHTNTNPSEFRRNIT